MYNRVSGVTDRESVLHQNRPKVALLKKKLSFQTVSRVCSSVTWFSEAVQNFGDFRQICTGKSRKIKKNDRPSTFPLCCSTGWFKKNLKLQYVIISSKFSPNYNFRSSYSLFAQRYIFEKCHFCRFFAVKFTSGR